MLILEVEQLGKGKYKVVREDGHFVTLYYREFKALEFKALKQCTDEQWAIAKKSVITRGKKRVFHLLSKKDYTESEIKGKLTKENYDEEDVQFILNYFIELGYIDDVNYLTKYYKCYKESKSKRIIEQKLKMKGIDASMIKDFFLEVDTENDGYLACKRAALKKYAGKEISKEAYPKMIQFLMRKGFDYGLCKTIIDQLFAGELEA